MATWAACRTEIQRLHKIPGVLARHRAINGGANNFQISVRDTRLRKEEQMTAACAAAAVAYHRYEWLKTSTGFTLTRITNV